MHGLRKPDWKRPLGRLGEDDGKIILDWILGK
jgi:hypothetical protein